MKLLSKASQELVRRRVLAVEQPPPDFTKPYTYSVKAGLIGGGTMATLGALVGSNVGIALFGTAISGAWILAPALGLVGLAAGAAMKRDS